MSDLLGEFRDALVGRYDVEGVLNEGGMASVFLARDVRHRRRVAIKVLKPELHALLGLARFQAEIAITAGLQHGNLLPLFDSGEARGHLYYVMPYVDGETLRARLAREGALPVEEAVRIATGVAHALAHAHRQGVIHRDLKPDNILLQDGEPLVADFGIALAVTRGTPRHTDAGITLGTPAYMSPEQAAGERELDGQSDQFALGTVTYEMLTGHPPFEGPTPRKTIARLLTEEAPPLATVRPGVPPHVEAAVRRALAKRPADRFASTRDFARALAGREGHADTGDAAAIPPAAGRRRAAWLAVAAAVLGAVAYVLGRAGAP